MKIQLEKNFYIKHERWTQEIQDQFDMIMLNATMLDYKIVKIHPASNSHFITIFGENRISIVFHYSDKFIIDRFVVKATKRNDCVFSTYQFQEAINYINSLL